MKKIMIVLMFSLLSYNSYADDSKEQLALQLLELSHIQETLNTTISSYSVQLDKSIPNLTQEELNTYFQKAMGWDISKPALIKVMTELYTEEELKGVIKFLQTPIGKAYSEKSPIFSQKFAQIIMGNFQQALQYLKERLQSKQQTD